LVVEANRRKSNQVNAAVEAARKLVNEMVRIRFIGIQSKVGGKDSQRVTILAEMK